MSDKPKTPTEHYSKLIKAFATISREAANGNMTVLHLPERNQLMFTLTYKYNGQICPEVITITGELEKLLANSITKLEHHF